MVRLKLIPDSDSVRPAYYPMVQKGCIMQRDEIIGRYRHLRALTNRHLNAALDCVAASTLNERVRHLGITRRGAQSESEEEMSLVFDLAVHTSKPGRSRAIDRYARAVEFAAGSDEDRTLQALCNARFSIWRLDRRHEQAGVVVTDVLRGGETWLLDENMASSAELDGTFASRLSFPDAFAVTCGVVVPVDAVLLHQVLNAGTAWMQTADPVALGDDPRFATALYRAATGARVMDQIRFRVPGRRPDRFGHGPRRFRTPPRRFDGS